MVNLDRRKVVKPIRRKVVNLVGISNRVALIGFGSFSIAKRAARTGRNPQTGKAIKIAAKKVAKFKAGAELAKAVK